jgi:hypothetical protein
VKLAELAGMLFKNKNDKVGQQDIQYIKSSFYQEALKKKQFPDTSNNCY